MKQFALGPVPPKLYWHLMGRFRPAPTVTSAHPTVKESLGSGLRVVELLEALKVISPESVILHIGSGIGRVETHLAPRVKFCFGADISPAMVEKARELVPHSNVEFRCTRGEDLEEWRNESLDLVLSMYVFQHLPRDLVSRYLSDSFQKLRPGGKVVFQVIVDERRQRSEPHRTHPYAIRYYTRAAVHEVLSSLGFTDILTVQMDGAPDPGNDEGDLVFVANRPEV